MQDGIVWVQDGIVGVQDGIVGVHDGIVGVQDGIVGVQDGIVRVQDGIVGVQDGIVWVQEGIVCIAKNMLLFTPIALCCTHQKETVWLVYSQVHQKQCPVYCINRYEPHIQKLPWDGWIRAALQLG